MSAEHNLVLRFLGEQDYLTVWHCMQQLTELRNAQSADEIWFLSHPPVYTQGQAGRPEHLLNTGNIPVVQIDRGGQVTYHGPGQLVAYLLIDVRRAGLGVRSLVSIMEDAIIEVLAGQGVEARTRERAPGVYVAEAKIASLGLRIRRGCSYHGLALNLDMDLRPFAGINPCGYQGMAVTQLASLVAPMPTVAELTGQLQQSLQARLPPYRAVNEQQQLPILDRPDVAVQLKQEKE
jgi:lipoyl(octanoyl) transferase